MNEIWKPILGFEGYYEVSNNGFIRSIERNPIRSDGKPHKIVSKVLKTAKDGNGYLRTALCINKKLTTVKIHRVVAEAFHGKSNLEVNHINGIKTDNSADNLEWVTRSENIKHSYKLKLQKPRKGIENNKSKLVDYDIYVIKRLFEIGWSSRKIAEFYQMDKSTMLDIKNKKTWSHV